MWYEGVHPTVRTSETLFHRLWTPSKVLPSTPAEERWTSEPFMLMLNVTCVCVINVRLSTILSSFGFIYLNFHLFILFCLCVVCCVDWFYFQLFFYYGDICTCRNDVQILIFCFLRCSLHTLLCVVFSIYIYTFETLLEYVLRLHLNDVHLSVCLYQRMHVSVSLISLFQHFTFSIKSNLNYQTYQLNLNLSVDVLDGLGTEIPRGEWAGRQ